MNIALYCYSILAVVTAYSAFAGAAYTNDWGEATNNVQMSLKLDGDMSEIKAAQSFRLLIRYRNISSNETFIVYEFNDTENDSSYSFRVTSPSGKDLSPDLTKFQEGLSGAVRGLEPAQTVAVKFNLSKLCKFDESGTYTIIAKKKMWSGAKKREFQVVSNALNVKVVANPVKGVKQ